MFSEVQNTVQWINSHQRSTSGLRTNQEPQSYALLASAMLQAATKSTDIRNAGSVELLSNLAARERQAMGEPVENQLLLEAAGLCLKAAGLLHTAVQEADIDDDPDVIEWLIFQRGNLIDLANIIDPPKPCHPFDQSNVVPFVPRLRGNL